MNVKTSQLSCLSSDVGEGDSRNDLRLFQTLCPHFSYAPHLIFLKLCRFSCFCMKMCIWFRTFESIIPNGVHFDRVIALCTKIHRYPIFSTIYFVMCKVYTGYHGTVEIEHGLCACTVDNLSKARGYLRY